MPKKHTRKQQKHKKPHGTANVLTVPELRRAFEHIDTFAKGLLHSSKSMDAKIAEFCEEWKRTFYREIKHDSAKVYLETLKEEMSTQPRGRKTRRLRGGSAPLGQAFMDTLSQVASRIVPAVSPPSVINDAVTAFNGQQLGQSPDPSQTRLAYQMAPYSQSIPNLAVSPINVNLKRDITVN